jgi:hypothetical protein
VARKQPSNEPEFRLRPRWARVPHDENKAWSRSFKNLIRLVRMTSKPAYPTQTGTAPRKPHLQRCAVRVTYSPNRVRGQWAAHGRYIARGSATKEASIKEVGFTATNDRMDIPQTLGQWQSAGDQRLFKLIISPEFGERLDIRRHTRELMARMEQDLGLRLEWIAVAHFNTDHPHIHIALRGRTATMLRTCVLPNWDSGRRWTLSKPSAGKWTPCISRPSTGELRSKYSALMATALLIQNRSRRRLLRASEHAACFSPLEFGP